MLEVRGLSIEVPGGRAVDDASFDIAPGEVLALVGESGAGKSLTGAALIGLLPPGARLAGGEMLWAGKRLDALDEAGWKRLRGRRIGAIFQDPLAALDPLQRVGTQLIATLRAHQALTRRAARHAAARWLEAVGLPHERARAYPHELSGGMRQRAAIAMALAPHPSLLIADEPTTALDATLRGQIILLLRRLVVGEGASMLLISHDLFLAAAAADRIAVMYAGRIVEVGSTPRVLHRPAHPYTAALIAARPSLEARPKRLPAIPGAMPPPGPSDPGCAFRPRCPRAGAACAAGRPPLPEAGVACWHPLHMPAEAEAANA